jgi:hypothetical protein
MRADEDRAGSVAVLEERSSLPVAPQFGGDQSVCWFLIFGPLDVRHSLDDSGWQRGRSVTR